MTLEPLLSSEQIELAIYRSVAYFGQEWTANLSALAKSIRHFGVEANNHSIVGRLEGLYLDKYIDLAKWSSGVMSARTEWRDGEQFFYAGDFKMQITPQGQKYFETLELREKAPGLDEIAATPRKERPLVFISCGQAVPAERALGRAMAQAVEDLSECEGYFAQNQTSLQGLSQHVLGALNRCAAFVAVLHHRGSVKTRHGEHIRASVWVEQEIAIAASRVHVTGQEIPVLIYIQNGIQREGLRDLLILNAIPFEAEDDVIHHFKEALSTGHFQPTASSISEEKDDPYERATRKQFEASVSSLDETAQKVLRRIVEHDSINEFKLIQEFGENVRDHLYKIENLGIIEHFVKEGEPRLHWRIKEHMRRAARLYFSAAVP